jgi:cobaltochelatase CobN
MIATIRSLTGRAPRRYFGDSADPDRPRVRDLKEEADRVFRSRVMNPKWLGAIREHGYRGATELTATVDYLFGYDATAKVVDDWQYERVAEQYALDADMRAFLRASNPWALRDIASRLLEAIDRGLWAASAEMRTRLTAAFLEAEGDLEDR